MDAEDSVVVCRQLGCPATVASVEFSTWSDVSGLGGSAGGAPPRSPILPIKMDDVNCRGHESALQDCSHGLGFQKFKSAEHQASLIKQLSDLHGKPSQNVRPRATIRVGTLEALEYFGESALLGTAGEGKKRAATVTTEGSVNVQLLSISMLTYLTTFIPALSAARMPDVLLSK